MTKSNVDHPILPPLVCGKLHGHLTMKVDEVLWCRKSPGEILVESKWWGDQQSVKFRPSNILQTSNLLKEDVIQIFDIKTTLTLFEIYLRNCEQLELFILKEDTNELIGRVYIKSLFQIATDYQYQSYFPIINSFGNRIGDLHVGFSLWMRQQKSLVRREYKDMGCLMNIDSLSLLLNEKDEDIQVKKKKGCNSCLQEKKPNMEKSQAQNLALSSSIPVTTVPPNTERSNYSDTVISDILSKGQQLRDAMVMSVLEDCDILKTEKDINLISSELGRLQRQSSDRPFSEKCSQDSSIKDQQKIVDYLLGKQMSEEEEAKALETLRSTSPAHSLLELVELHKEKVNEEETRSQIEVSSVQDYQNQQLSDRSAVTTKKETSQINLTTESGYPLPPEFDKVNCFRLTVKSLSLTSLGLRKVNPPQNKKSRYKAGGDTNIHPVIYYFIECHMDQNSVNQSQTWKFKPERFCSRRQIDNIVYFGQSSVYLVPTPFNLSGLNSILKSMTWLVCWKLLNQQTPSLLGTINFEIRSQVQSMETVWTLPVETADGTYGNVEILLELGRNKKYFGNILLEKETVKRNVQHNTVSTENMVKTTSNTMKEVKGKSKNIHTKKQKHFTELEINQKRNIILKNKFIKSVPTENVNNEKNIQTNGYESVNLEQNQCCIICRSQITNTAQSMSIPTQFYSDKHPLLCVQCQVPIVVNSKPNSILTLQEPSLMTHEFLLRIEIVKNCPLFVNSERDIKCYVDYKFLDVDVFWKACTAHDTITSRVINCNQEVNFASDHLHRVNIPAVTPLSSYLLSYKPGVTFQIWLRYFKPSPRDHMVAMAHLPTSKLSSLEFQFNSNYMEHPVIETIELPLILVPSSITAPYQQYHHKRGFGTIQISISYRHYLSSESNHLNIKERLEKKVKSSSKSYHQGIRWEHNFEDKENTEQNLVNSVSSKSLQTPRTIKVNCPKNKETKDKLTQTLKDCEKITTEKDEIEEQNFNFVRRRFWTGEIENKSCGNNYLLPKDNPSNIKNTNEKDKTVLLAYGINNDEFDTYLNDQLKKQAELGNELSDSGIYSLSVRDRIDLHTNYTSSGVREKQKNDFEPLVMDGIEDKDLTFYSLKSDISCLSVIDEYPSTSEMKQTESSEEFEDDKEDSVITIDPEKMNKETVKIKGISVESDSLNNCITKLSEKKDIQILEGEEVGNSSQKIYVNNEISQSNTKSVTLSEEETIEGLIENIESDHENLVSNEAVPQNENELTIGNSKEQLFKARVEIEQALHLSMITKFVNGEVKSVAPSTCVSFKCCLLGSPEILTTEIVKESCNPVWKACWEVELNTELLEQVDKRLVFTVLEEDMGRDFVFGYATADLNVIPLGLPRLQSWLNINDLSLTCKGQLKVNITPLEDVSQSKTKLVSNLATVGINKNNESNDCVYIAHGQFNTFPSFIASQTEIHITRISNNSIYSDSTDEETNRKVNRMKGTILKDKITEMEEFISGLKLKTLPCSDVDNKIVTEYVNLSDENMYINKEYPVGNSSILNHDEMRNEFILKDTNKEKTKEKKYQEDVVNPCTIVCRGCHHCICQHNDNVQELGYVTNPLILQRFLTNLSEMQISQLPLSISTSNIALNSEDYNLQHKLLKNYKDKPMTINKSTSCPQFEGALSQCNNHQDLILDQNISEFEQFLQGDKDLYGLNKIAVQENESDDLSSNATRASEISTDKSVNPLLEYCSLRETPEGGNPIVDVKSRSKLERQGTFVLNNEGKNSALNTNV